MGKVRSSQPPFIDVPWPTRICRASYLSLSEKLKRRRKKKPKFVRYFLQFSQLSERKIQKIVRIRPIKKSYSGKQGVLFFGFGPNLSAFVRFWKHRENDFSNFFSGNSFFDGVNIWCIVFFPVLKPLACGRQSRCLNWTYKLPGGKKFSIKLSPLSLGFSQRRPLNLIKRPRFINSPGVRFINHPACSL